MGLTTSDRVLYFLISALRSIVEMLGLCLLAQAVLAGMLGQARSRNPIYQMIAIITRGPRRLLALLSRAEPDSAGVGATTFGLLFVLWIGLAWLRKLL